MTPKWLIIALCPLGPGPYLSERIAALITHLHVKRYVFDRIIAPKVVRIDCLIAHHGEWHAKPAGGDSSKVIVWELTSILTSF